MIIAKTNLTGTKVFPTRFCKYDICYFDDSKVRKSLKERNILFNRTFFLVDCPSYKIANYTVIVCQWHVMSCFVGHCISLCNVCGMQLYCILYSVLLLMGMTSYSITLAGNWLSWWLMWLQTCIFIMPSFMKCRKFFVVATLYYIDIFL